MPALRAIATEAPASTPNPRPKRPGHLMLNGVDILACGLTNVPVTVTNPHVGTVLVTMQAFGNYRRLSEERGIIHPEEKRSEIICELASDFSLSRPFYMNDEKVPDVNGNTMLKDFEIKILFIVDERRSLLLAAYDTSKPRDNR
ncbi:MAG: hypothetical protein QY323_04590 [Patescibacteria group bacterium]|nr:MAG: hypothetical protein QY323_04590 [Patescibacteria group bacterium]